MQVDIVHYCIIMQVKINVGFSPFSLNKYMHFIKVFSAAETPATISRNSSHGKCIRLLGMTSRFSGSMAP